MIILQKRGVATSRTACFRVDAGPEIGFGHFMRCKSIALELVRRGWNVFMIGENLPSNTKSACPALTIVKRKTNHNDTTDMSLYLDEITSRRYSLPELVVFDSYKFSRNALASVDLALGTQPSPSSLLNTTKIITVVIDDIASRDTPAQVVINPNPLMSSEPYERQHIPTILCGAKYTIIRNEILAFRERKYDSHGHILITLGGGDVSELLLKVLNSLPEDIDRNICVSVSSACPLENIMKWIDKKPERRFINIDMETFPELLAGASFVITAGGTTLWETYCLGIPNITIVWVDNQINTIKAVKSEATSFLVDLISKVRTKESKSSFDSSENLKSQLKVKNNYKVCEIIRTKKTGILIEEASNINSTFFKEALEKLLFDENLSLKMRTKQRNLIDGKGVERIVNILETLRRKDVPLYF